VGNRSEALRSIGRFLAQVLLSLNREYEIKLPSVDVLAMDKLSLL
jgi:hypothetical protein